MNATVPVTMKHHHDNENTQEESVQLVTGFINFLRYEKQYSPHTISNYQRDLDQFRGALADKKPLIQVQGYDIRHYIGLLHHQNISNRSIQRKLSSIRSFYRFLNRERVVSHNPADSLPGPKAEKHLPKILDIDQAQAFFDQTPEGAIAIRDWAILEILYSCGLRVSELASLNLDSIHYQEKLLRVVGKGNKSRIVPIGKVAISAVEKWLDTRTEFTKDSQEQALFVNQKGSRLSIRSIQQRVKTWGEKKGLDQRLHPHLLRHSFASHILESSGDLRAVQELLGHEDISTTQIYTHLDFQHLAKVYDKAHPRSRKK